MRLFVLLALAGPCVLHAQDGELVLNGGFEQVQGCPEMQDGRPLKRLREVKAVHRSPTLFHRCATGLGVPANWAGAQEPHEGDAYIGLVATAQGAECGQRQFVQLKLAQPLTNGHRYRLRFHVSLADASGYMTDRIGACFLPDDRSRKGVAERIGRPDVDNAPDRFIGDTAGWMVVEGIYHALGGERYIVIGNFQECGRSSRKAVTPNSGAGVLHNMKAKAALDLDPDVARSRQRRDLAKQAYLYVDAVSLMALPSNDGIRALDEATACPPDVPPASGVELVPDPGFDLNGTRGAPWRNASNGTPDFLHSTTGIYLHSAVNRDNREYILTQLNERPDPCGIYRISMRVRRDRSYGYATDRIGVALVESFARAPHRGLLPLAPVWESQPGHMLLSERDLLLCGTIEAPGCVRHLIVGNFTPDSAIHLLRTDPQGGPFAYYLVDDISLRQIGMVPGCDLRCDTLLVPAATWLDAADTTRQPIPIRFGVASDVPDTLDPRVVEEVLGLLAEDPRACIRVTGHTDNTGREADNMKLARRRAEHVARLLKAAGVPAERLRIQATGSAQPVSDEGSAEGRAMNRRVELLAVPCTP